MAHYACVEQFSIGFADVAEEIAHLKQQPGKNIFVTGDAKLAQSLTCLGLIDECHMTIHPVVLESGKPHFKDLPLLLNLKLASTKNFETGAIQLTYQKA